MDKFNVGDFVKFADGITAKDMGIIFTPVDLKKVYRIAMKDGKKSYKLDDVALSCFSFAEDWLSPAEDTDEKKSLGEQVNSALEDFLTSISNSHKASLKPGDYVVVLKDDIKDFGKSVGMKGSSWIDEFPDTPLKIKNVIGPAVTLEDFPRYFLHQDWVRLADKVEAREKALGIKDVKFNRPATIVFWTDGTKTVVKCRKGDKWDAEKGLAMACAKKLLGNRDGYHEALTKYYKKEGRWQDDMDTGDIRGAVRHGCATHPCEECPCRPKSRGGSGKCDLINTAPRESLIAMLEEFEKAGKWSYEDWRQTHA